MPRRRGPSYKKATKAQRMFFAVGLPARYWRSRQVAFNSFVAERPHMKAYRVSGQEQLDAFEALAADLDRNMVIAIGSSPTDELAMIAAARLAKAAIKVKMLVEYVNLGSSDPPWERRNDDVPAVVVIHNLSADATSARLQTVRDWIGWAEDALRIVVIAGANPVEFFDTRLRTPFDAAFYSEVIRTRKTRRV